MKSLDRLLEYLKKIGDLNYISGILHWEMDTVAPKKSLEYLIEVNTEVELQAFSLSTSEEYINLINEVINDEEFNKLPIEEQRYIVELKEVYDRESKIPEDFYEEYSKTCSESNLAWKEAKEKKEFSIFKPYLEKIITLTKELYGYMYPNSTNIYDDMLDTYEKDIKSDIIDKLFDELKEKIIPIVKQLKKQELVKDNNTYTEGDLLNIGYKLLDYIGFDNERGKLGIYPHGYTTKLNNNDIRITFSNNKSIFDHMCTIIHEGGHGIFEQSIGDNLKKYPGYNIDKYALHESQSRFFENILGRNKNFWLPIYDSVKEDLNLDLDLDEFIRHLNDAKVSFVRTEADELTYCLHIIMRYEIERDIFNNKIKLEDLESIWNQKAKEYLGLDVESPDKGILQDVHWSQGSFGYFPSYLLGSIFDGMLLENINDQVGNVDELLKSGRIKEITKYLQNNIHIFGGSYNINEVAKRICGKELTVEPIVKYFEDKYLNK